MRCNPAMHSGPRAYRAHLFPGESLPDSELRRRILRGIEVGRLPLLISSRLSGGYGPRGTCIACSRAISAGHIDVEVAHAGESRAPLVFHIRCHVLWQIECIRRMREALALAGGAASISPLLS